MSLQEEELVTGWEPGVPVDDTLLRRFLFHQAALGEAVALEAGGHTLSCDDFQAADARHPAGFWNAAVLLRPPRDWDAVLDEVELFFSGGHGEAMLWSAWPTPDLRPRGWRLSGHPPVLVRPPLTMAPLPVEAQADVHRVTTPAELATWEQVAAAAYPLPVMPAAPGVLMPPSLLGDERAAFYLGYAGGEAVSAAASFVAHGIASFAFAATIPHARGTGQWHGLARARLLDLPACWMTGIFSDLSRPLAERIGFVPVVRLTLWILDRGMGPHPA